MNLKRRGNRDESNSKILYLVWIRKQVKHGADITINLGENRQGPYHTGLDPAGNGDFASWIFQESNTTRDHKDKEISIVCNDPDLRGTGIGMESIRVTTQPTMDPGEGMNLGEALAIKAKEQGIQNFAFTPNRRKPSGKPTGVTDEEIVEAWKEGYSRYSIAKHICKINIAKVRRVVKEYEAGKVRL